MSPIQGFHSGPQNVAGGALAPVVCGLGAKTKSAGTTATRGLVPHSQLPQWNDPGVVDLSNERATRPTSRETLERSRTMKIRVRVDLGEIRFDKVFSGATDAELFRQFRQEAQVGLPWTTRMQAKLLSDISFMKRVVEMHNKKASSREPLPASATEFVSFGKRVGYVTVL